MISISRILHSLHTVLLVHLGVDVILFDEKEKSSETAVPEDFLQVGRS